MRLHSVLIIFSLISSNSYAYTTAEGSINLPVGETASNDLTFEVTVYTIGEPILFINPYGYYDETTQQAVIISGENSVDFSVPFDLILGRGFSYGIYIYCSSCEEYYAGKYELQVNGSTNVAQADGSSNALYLDTFPKLDFEQLLSPINFSLIHQTGDIDEDTILNSEDNCILTANTDQVDTDNNGVGNSCDVDDDGDSILDTEDNCPLIINADQTDSSENGIGDACQPETLKVDEELCFPIKASVSNNNVALICL